MRRFGLTAIGLVAIFGVGEASATASGIATFIQPQASAPVQIVGCNAGLQHVSNGWGTDFYRLNMFAQFRNATAKTAVAVLVRFQLADAFGGVLGNRFGESSGHFSPQVEIDGQKWSDTDTWPGLGVVRCSVARVLFDDGSTWADEGAPQPSPT